MKTEREVIETALRRLNLILNCDMASAYKEKNSIYAKGYYDIQFKFDDDGNLLDIDPDQRS